MPKDYDMIIRINSDRAEVEVEQHSKKGVITRKNISPESLSNCILTSRLDDESHPTGLLPEGCIAVVMEKKYVYYYIRYPELYTDFSYFGTEYPHFPIPRLVFCFKYSPKTKKVAEASLCVVKDERLTLDTPTYQYPFSNVHNNLSICLGNNALPVYKDPARLHTLAAYILRLPNNNDLYSSQNNRLHAGFRDLLEQMKHKTPSHYYTDVLVESRETLKDFLSRR
ncbi:MAG: prokaryotic E2 ligase family D protein [Oscillospiraceae bacterium]|nr:prokaryotic E2 ligase family D protein [Oscillospiraceae bacterium]